MRAALALVSLCVSSPLAIAGIIVDTFSINKDYAGGNVTGTIWSGVLNSGNLSVGNANISNPGRLTWGSIPNSGWEGSLANGPFLYRMVNGDFDVSVQVAGMTNNFFSDGGLLVRVPNVADAGPGEDYLGLRYFGAFGFNATRNTNDGSTANTNYPAFDPFIRITRTGAVFDFFTRPNESSAWVLRDRVTRADMGAVGDLQVGLWFGTFTNTTGQARFDNFTLSGPNVVVPEPSAFVLASLLSFGAIGRLCWRRG